jgi:hypothetical protein
METADQMQERWAKEIADAGAMTEQQMREAKVPTPDTPEELIGYVRRLVDRPHDYGTCCYAMSMAAVAAFNFVARRLGVSGFQASCADMDILARTRGWQWGRLLNYEDLLYPQYCNEENFPSAGTLLAEHREELAKRAAEKLAASEREGFGSESVKAHWRTLVANGQGGGK